MGAVSCCAVSTRQKHGGAFAAEDRRPRQPGTMAPISVSCRHLGADDMLAPCCFGVQWPQSEQSLSATQMRQPVVTREFFAISSDGSKDYSPSLRTGTIVGHEGASQALRVEACWPCKAPVGTTTSEVKLPHVVLCVLEFGFSKLLHAMSRRAYSYLSRWRHIPWARAYRQALG